MRKTCFLVSSSSPSSATGAFTALAALGMLCCLACSQPGPAPQKNDAAHKLTGWQEQRLSNYLTTVMPQAHAMVKSGDLITRLGSDITSEMLRQLNQTDKSYSHCGIASIENDSVFVYHAIGGEFNPSQKIKRELLASFGHPTENKALGVFRPNITSGEKTLLLKMVKGLYHAGVPFDMDFDYATNNQLYCAEMVAKCMAFAHKNANWMAFSRRGTFRYVAVDNLFLSPMMQRQNQWQY